jgi:hypothetical protein
MPPPTTISARRLIPALVGGAALVAITTWVVLAVLRVSYPFELEWQEGGMLAHVSRVRAGEGLYAEPSLGFMAFPYPPLFVWAASLLGESFTALRLVSILATAGLLALLFRHVVRATDSALGGLVAAGLFAACYRFTGAWFDVGRVDMLALVLAMGSVHLARFGKGLPAACFAGGLLGLACLTKQTSLLVAGPMVVPLFAANRRAAFAFVLAALAVGGGGVAALHLASEGWSSWYLFELLAGHPWHPPKLLGFWTEDVVWLAPAVALGLVGRRGVSGAMPLALILGLLAAAWLGRAHQGGFDNTLLPLALLAALLAGEAVGRYSRRALVGSVVLLQFGLLALGYSPSALVPRAQDRAAGERVIARLAKVEGEVLAPYQGYLARRAGHGPSVHGMAVIDLLSSTRAQDEAARFVGELERALNERRYGALLLPAEDSWSTLPALGANYRRAEDLLEGTDESVLRPPTGRPARPRWLYVPRE